MAIFNNLKNRIVEKAKESTESKLSPEEKTQKADDERRRALDLQQKRFDDERIARENKKRKRNNMLIFIGGAILLVLIIVLSFTVDSTIKDYRYQKGTEYILSGEYESASKKLDKLKYDYKDAKKLSNLAKALSKYDKDNYDTYYDAISSLSSVDKFENKKIQKLRDNKLDEATRLNDKHLEVLNSAEYVTEAINSACTDVNLESYNRVVKVKELYDSQSDEVKSYINNAYMLDDALNDIKRYKDYYDKGKAVQAKIQAIGKVTLKSKDKIEDARKAYDALSYDEVKYVGNYSVLVKAEKKYKELKKKDKSKDSKDKDKTTTKKSKDKKKDKKESTTKKK